MSPAQRQALVRIQDRLADIYSPRRALAWLAERRPEWSGRNAYQMLATGRQQAVLEAVDTLRRRA